MSAIEVKNLVKKFHGQTVLHGIDLEVKPGEVVAIIGPSGSGKTTLLRSINLLEQPEAGTITVGDITIDTARSLSQQKSLIRQLRQHVGFVFQNFNLFPHRTVLENIIEGPVIVKGEPKEEATARARELLAKVGLAGKETSYPRRLSGGQQQRVAIARALAGAFLYLYFSWYTAHRTTVYDLLRPAAVWYRIRSHSVSNDWPVAEHCRLCC